MNNAFTMIQRLAHQASGDDSKSSYTSSKDRVSSNRSSTYSSSANDDKRGASLTMEEYERPGWTFHAKGLWLCVGEEASTGSGSGSSHRHSTSASTLPRALAVYVGSSNLGERSWARDLELGFIVRTTDPQLIRASMAEVQRLRQHAKPLPMVAEKNEGIPRVVRLKGRVQQSLFMLVAKVLKSVL